MFCPTTKVTLHDDLPYLIICPTIFAFLGKMEALYLKIF